MSDLQDLARSIIDAIVKDAPATFRLVMGRECLVYVL